MGTKGSKIPAPNLIEDSSTFPYVRGSQEARDRSHKVNYVNTWKADGIYIPSFNKTKCFSNLGKTNLTVLGSAHNQKEIKEKLSE